MKITLNGYYGFANYGDDLFNLTSVLGAQRWWSAHRVDILGPPVAGIDARFRVPGWFPRPLYTAPGFAGKLSRLSFLAGALLRTDLLLYAGGSTLSYGSIMKKVQRVAAEKGITQFAAVGVSVGPFADAADEAEAARFLRKFIYMSVRDQKSVDLLARLEVPIKPVLTRDLVGALPALLPPRTDHRHNGESGTPANNGRRCLGVSLCYFESLFGGDLAVEERRNEALFEGIERFARRSGVLTRIYCLNTHPRWGDFELSQQLQVHLQERGLPVELISAEDNLLGCWHGLAACDAVLSVRLHGAITAYLCGVPFSLVEYHRKCGDLAEDIGQSSDLRLSAYTSDSAEVEGVLDRLFAQPPHPRLPRETYIADAVQNFTQAPWADAAV